MDIRMFAQTILSLETFITHIAWIQLFSSMCLFVFIQISYRCKPFVTQCTHIWFRLVSMWMFSDIITIGFNLHLKGHSCTYTTNLYRFKPNIKSYQHWIWQSTRYAFCGTRYLSHCRTIPAATVTIWGQVTSSGTWPFHSQYAVSYRWSIITTVCLSCTVTMIWSLKYFGVTTLAFLGHVTSSVTWPFNSQNNIMVSYKWFIETTALSRIVAEILHVKH